MSRLLQGDVGSGKTFVAMCAMLLAVDSGVQAALMAGGAGRESDRATERGRVGGEMERASERVRE